MKNFDYWMLSVIDQALQTEYQLAMEGGKIGKMLQSVVEQNGLYGMEIAKKVQAELDNNKFHPLGQIALTRKRIQEIKDEYANALNDVKKA